jgi:hypothetical protein
MLSLTRLERGGELLGYGVGRLPGDFGEWETR